MKITSVISTLWSILGDYKKSAIFLLFIMIVFAVTESLSLGMILPLLETILNPGNYTSRFAFITDFLNHFSHEQHLLIICSITISLVVTKSLFSLLHAYYSIRFITNLRRDWTLAIMINFMHSKFAHLIRQKQGVLLNNMITEPTFAAKGIRDLIDFLAKAIPSIFLIFLLFSVNWQISAIVFLFCFLIMLIVWRSTHKYSFAVGKKKIKLNQQISGVAAESIAGIRQIKTYSMENAVIHEFSGRLRTLFNIIVKFSVISTIPRAFGEVIIVVIALGMMIFYEKITNSPVSTVLPLMGFFLLGTQRLFGNLTALMSQRMSIISYIPSLKLVNNIIEDSSSLEDVQNGNQIVTIKNNLNLSNIHFYYDKDNPLFENLQINIPKGSITAIAGPSGSGKSTICDLLIGFYRPISGEILIDGKDLKDFNIKSWRNNIGYVSQDSFLFNVSVKENIIIGKPDAGDDEVLLAATQAGASEFIDALPEKYDTVLGDSGLSLSGGQQQRIAIARALIRNPEILIFDEATSALDSKTERSILDLLKSLRGDKTILLITHRLSSLDLADKIYLLDKGSISESGTYSELQQKKGLFWKLEEISGRKTTNNIEANISAVK